MTCMINSLASHRKVPGKHTVLDIRKVSICGRNDYTQKD